MRMSRIANAYLWHSSSFTDLCYNGASHMSSLASILRISPELLANVDKALATASGKKSVVAELERDIALSISSRLTQLGLSPQASAEEVFSILHVQTKRTNAALHSIFYQPRFDTEEGCRTVLNAAYELAGQANGFFLKTEVAREFVRKNPPRNVMKELGYNNVDDLLAKEDIWEIFASLRFAEDIQWLNTVFFRPYEDLRPSDFEERKIVAHVLEKKWTDIGKRYVGHKLHNVSHLKELGVIFILPYEANNHEGETTQVFGLILHYFHEILFYANLFRRWSRQEHFTTRLTAALRGDVEAIPRGASRETTWRIIERYLAKDDASDPRLFEPHVNPEAVHWKKGEMDIWRLSGRFSQELSVISFWKDLDYVGQYFFSPELKRDVLVSFDLIDNIISYVRQADMESNYLYHQQEALWNELFARYIGQEKMEELTEKFFDRGYLQIPEDL